MTIRDVVSMVTEAMEFKGDIVVRVRLIGDCALDCKWPWSYTKSDGNFEAKNYEFNFRKYGTSCSLDYYWAWQWQNEMNYTIHNRVSTMSWLSSGTDATAMVGFFLSSRVVMCTPLQ